MQNFIIYVRTVLNGEESYQKAIYHLLWDILVRFHNTFCCYYLKYLRAVNEKPPWMVL